jgi:hypothetical protein
VPQLCRTKPLYSATRLSSGATGKEKFCSSVHSFAFLFVCVQVCKFHWNIQSVLVTMSVLTFYYRCDCREAMQRRDEEMRRLRNEEAYRLQVIQSNRALLVLLLPPIQKSLLS